MDTLGVRAFNVRMGFANNSSSSHSLIFLANTPADYDVEDHTFGWEFFTAASHEAKNHYMALLLNDALYNVADPHMAQAVVKAWTGIDAPVNELGLGVEGYIDHESRYELPFSWDERGVDFEFFKAFQQYILQDGLVILGGNNNTSKTHKLGRGFKLPIPQDTYRSRLVARHDARYDFWALFDRATGNKIRMRFGKPDELNVVPEKASAPELVDIKITDHCPFACNFCYQDSTVAGGHAKSSDIYHIAQSLSRLRVFEVAIGGGEPTMHPQFVNILTTFRNNHIVPNFTT